MHNGYFYPQDIKIVVKDGERRAYVDFTLPIRWTDEALKVAKINLLSGWEQARRAYEKEQEDLWYKEVYTNHWDERVASRAWKGSVSSFREVYESGECGKA